MFNNHQVNQQHKYTLQSPKQLLKNKYQTKLFNFNISYLALSLLLGTNILTGCSSPDNNQTPNTSNTPINSQTNNTNNNQVLKLLYWQAPTILNPHLATGNKDFDAGRIVYEPLASFDQDSKLIPILAETIPTLENGGIAADGKSVTWRLKKDVQWSDGKPFTAKDVVFTYKFVTNPQVASPNIEYYKKITDVQAIDDHTVKIIFNEPNPTWAIAFTGQTGVILPEHIFNNFNGANVREAPANQMPIGTGPYQVVQFKPGDMIVYQANPNYWEKGKPYFQTIELKGGGDAASAARAVLQTGDADFAFNLQVESNVLKQLETGGKGKAVANISSYVERISFNFSDPNQANAAGEKSAKEIPHPFFTDKKVRQAFNLAIDRQTINDQLYGASGQPTAQILVAPESYRSQKITSEFNLEKAKQLLDEAGWQDTNNNGMRDKNGVEMRVLFQTSVNPIRQKTQEIVKQSLQSLGVGVELKSVDPAIFFSGDPANTDTVNHFQADLQMFSTGNDTPDVATYMKNWLCDEVSQKSNNWQKKNYARYCQPEYDKLWQEANQAMDPVKRAELFQKTDEFLAEDIAVMPIVHRFMVQGVSNNLTSIKFSPWDANTWDIKNWQRRQP
jgi:peptide/nickel transport system substrate-binding protein